MPERDGYAPGTPSWVDLSTPDVEAAKRLLRRAVRLGPPRTPGPVEETGGYAFFLSDGRKVAGVAPLITTASRRCGRRTSPPTTSTRSPPASPSSAATSLLEPMDVMDSGRMAFFAHPAGGMFGAWQAGTHNGAELVNEPVCLAWNTLITPSPEDAAAFFGLIFGLSTETQRLRRRRLRRPDARRERRRRSDEPAARPARRRPRLLGRLLRGHRRRRRRRARGRARRDAADGADGACAGVGRIATVTDPWGASFSVAAITA